MQKILSKTSGWILELKLRKVYSWFTEGVRLILGLKMPKVQRPARMQKAKGPLDVEGVWTLRYGKLGDLKMRKGRRP